MFTTQNKCREIIKPYFNLELDKVFDASVKSEIECVQKARGAEEGCCLSDPCKFGTRESCQGDFVSGKLCSVVTQCECTAQHSTGCVDGFDEVYWFDSCGNKENIYGTAYDKNGFALSKEKAFDDPERKDIGNERSLISGNCDISLSTTCMEADDVFLSEIKKSSLSEDVKSKLKFMCGGMSCESTFVKDKGSDLTVAWMQGQKREVGESWCEYEGATGEGKDLVGSRQYVRSCINGQEVLEPCFERREEICVMNDIDKELLGTSKDVSSAACVPNLWEGCLKANDQDGNCGLSSEEKDKTSCGGECDVYKDENGDVRKDKDGNSMLNQLKECCNKQACKEKACKSGFYDCNWNDGLKLCSPNVPPGTLEVTSEKKELVAEFSSESKKACEVGGYECVEIWARKGTEDWKCVENCDCHKKVTGNVANNFCRSLGDCGAHLNVVGYYSEGGFSFTGSKIKAPGLLGDEKEIGNNAEDFDKKTDFSDFKSATEPLTKSIFFTNQIIGLVSSKINAKDFSKPDWWKENTGRFVVEIVVASGTLIVGGILVAGTLGWLEELEATAASATTAAAAGVTVGAAAGATTAVGSVVSFLGVIFWPLLVFAVIGGIILWLSTIYEIREVPYKLTCSPWIPPDKGEDCEKCNDKNLFSVCDEYKCTSLGRSCKPIEQTPGEVLCIWENPKDTRPPVIKPYLIAPNTLEDLKIYPPDSKGYGGYELKNKIKYRTPVKIGIETDEFAQCKISRSRNRVFEIKEGVKGAENIKVMQNEFGDNLDKKIHVMEIPIAQEPLNVDEDTIAVEKAGENTFYVRCESTNGAANLNDYFIRFTVEAGKDSTPVEIETYSIESGARVRNDVNSMDVTILLNEPVENCRWSKEDTTFDKMTESFGCLNTAISGNLFACSTTLTDIKLGDNTYYFKCKDKNGNINEETQPRGGHKLTKVNALNITDFEPENVKILERDVEIKLKTKNGAEDGKAICYYSFKEFLDVNGLRFSETNGLEHAQNFTNLNNGKQKVYTWCFDAAGNEVSKLVEFTIEPDTKMPGLEAIYTEGSLLNIELDEDASCEYSAIEEFTFGDGTAMLRSGKKYQLSMGSDNKFFIRCRDSFSNELSIVVKV